MNKVIAGSSLLGTVLIGGLIYFVTAGPIDMGKLSVDGFTDCTPMVMECPVNVNKDSAALLGAISAVGKVPEGTNTTLAFPSLTCTNPKTGERVVQIKTESGLSSVEQMSASLGIADVGLCKPSTCSIHPTACSALDVKQATEQVSPSCAWRPKGTPPELCTRIDGSDPGDENTMMPGAFKGAGCQLKNCYVIAGQGQ